MNKPPYFAAYREASPPAYARWLAVGTSLLAMLGAAGVLLRPFIEPRVAALLAAVVLLVWLLALMLRMLVYRLNRHNAHLYAQEVEKVESAWWARYRQHASLMSCLLLGTAGSTAEQWQQVLARQQRPPLPVKEGEGNALRLLSVFGMDLAERERQLARLLAMQWREQLPGTLDDAPLACYWLGTPLAWNALVSDMAEHCPDLRLPAQPLDWQGQKSLDAIIERLQHASPGERILFAGCRSMPASKDDPLPAGEGALLWLLGAPDQGVELGRGEWYAAAADSLAKVARQACQQRHLSESPEVCVSFKQAGVLEQSEFDWRLSGHLQDAFWGYLGDLEAAVTQSLAAIYAQQQGKACGWLAKSPSHSLILGVVSPEHESA